MPAIRLAEVPEEVRALISDGMFYGASRVLTLVAMHHPDLDFTTIYSGYANGWSADAMHVLGESCYHTHSWWQRKSLRNV